MTKTSLTARRKHYAWINPMGTRMPPCMNVGFPAFSNIGGKFLGNRHPLKLINPLR